MRSIMTTCVLFTRSQAPNRPSTWMKYNTSRPPSVGSRFHWQQLDGYFLDGSDPEGALLQTNAARAFGWSAAGTSARRSLFNPPHTWIETHGCLDTSDGSVDKICRQRVLYLFY